MQVLKLVRQYNCPITYDLGQEIGVGAHGQVFELLDNPVKIIKLCVLYEYGINPYNEYARIRDIVQHVMDNKPNPYVGVYAHGYLGTHTRATYNGTEQKLVLYYYVMEKLSELSANERTMFDSIISQDDMGVIKNLSASKFDATLKDLKRTLDFDPEMVKLFCREVKASELRQEDSHHRNIMKRQDGSFVFIDLERCVLIKP
jgi:serine/threonine protein kinase